MGAGGGQPTDDMDGGQLTFNDGVVGAGSQLSVMGWCGRQSAFNTHAFRRKALTFQKNVNDRLQKKQKKIMEEISVTIGLNA